MLELKIHRLDKTQKLPVKAYPTDAGIDICSLETVILEPGGRHRFRSGLKFDIPTGYCLVCMPKSGLSIKNGIGCLAPLIDEGYTSECSVVLVNHSKEIAYFNIGDKLAQYVLMPVPQYQIVEVNEIRDKDRGDKGFGSSGV